MVGRAVSGPPLARYGLADDSIESPADFQGNNSLEGDVTVLSRKIPAARESATLAPRGFRIRNEFVNRKEGMSGGVERLTGPGHFFPHPKAARHPTDDAGLGTFHERNREKFALTGLHETDGFGFGNGKNFGHFLPRLS